MKIEDSDWTVVIVVAMLFWCFAFTVGETVGGCRKEREAVTADVAEWVADDSGKAEFKWITDD